MLAAICLTAGTPCANAQSSFSSGSDGSDGAYAPNLSGNFTPSQFTGSGVANNVFNFTTVTIPKGVTITLTANVDNQPVYWLASGNVDIEGTLNLAGANGAPVTLDVDVRLPAVAGSGGYGGGVGGNGSTSQNATAGSGPGGGAADLTGQGACTWQGSFKGNQFLVPLVGGSGGGGQQTSGQFGSGGGSGGGAILIASSTQIIVNGLISANGGNNGSGSYYAGNGSGGAIRLVSNTITGTGTLTALGGNTSPYCSPNNNPGRVRLEAYTLSFSGSLNGTPESQSNPLPLFIPTGPQPSIQVTSINGTSITENPFSFPDLTINTGSPIPLVITAHQIPVGTVPTLYVFSEGQDQQALPCTGGLQGTLTTSTCSMNITYPFGGSRGLVKATWTPQ